MPDLYIDADGCPVKDEIYKVAERYQFKVFVVANKPIHVPLNVRIQMIVVPGGMDEADHWIAEHIQEGDIAITGDIPLADRCLKKNARALAHKGDEFTHDNIGSMLASRELMSRLREMGEVRGGPAPFEKKDRSKFLASLDRVIQSALRAKK